MVERAVGIVKGIMRKAKEDKRDYLVGLMEYRNTPISSLDLSPAQMMFNRILKTKLPISNKLLNAELFNNIREKLIERQNIQKLYYDKTAHPLPELKQGENVRILNFKNKTWESAKIVSKHKLHPRSYFVKNQSGKILRCNRKHNRKTNTSFHIETDPNDISTFLSDSEVVLYAM
ncbi:integrase catalytic domain-containing protein [Nephila pilipes]|uniref:Integrase catalytic domain-containing protein n=1 Tax=Nephila pilipes TaxID=299642 RepID=A0A8X6UQG9_NEPPI|nr:integrase catalytic domain-containing protein [Nephila pilipes]